MRPALELTSVPDWAVEVTSPPADLTGRQWTIIAIGDAGMQVARRWYDDIACARTEPDVRVHEMEDADAACAALRGDLADARVGWRLMIAGPAHTCLTVRAAAVAAGVADDEMTVAATEVARRAVQCAHCRAVTVADVELEGVVVCAGCDRELVVHYHVSRRLGTHLGYLAS
ncbi:hypothetical protein AU194_00585 [Mycobacterium sp. GA-2829]|nr:dimethylamine monooxygenase subunit DmmA family protein [Mycobacterium sp. GA-2829]KUI25507.1 hypothetical protein AU194_00585 [Mycobacterium sp. GA-2829]